VSEVHVDAPVGFVEPQPEERGRMLLTLPVALPAAQPHELFVLTGVQAPQVAAGDVWGVPITREDALGSLAFVTVRCQFIPKWQQIALMLYAVALGQIDPTQRPSSLVVPSVG